MKYDTIQEAAQAWVEGFNAIPSSIVEKLGTEEVYEITPPSKYDRVYIYNGAHRGEYGEIIKRQIKDPDKYQVELDGSQKKVWIDQGDFEVERDGFLPMWGTLWAFGENIDNDWLSGEFSDAIGGGLQEMADCGFRIYEQEDYGYIFGIDGAGYNFYTDHWIPLYKARGLQWHKTPEELERERLEREFLKAHYESGRLVEHIVQQG